jgi:hypothetical protein
MEDYGRRFQSTGFTLFMTGANIIVLRRPHPGPPPRRGSNLYEAMGCVRKSERASGLTKKSSAAQVAAKK